MKRLWVCLVLFVCCLGLWCSAVADLGVNMDVRTDGENQIVTFSVQTEEEMAEAAAALQDTLDDRFKQSEAFRMFARVLGRGGERTIHEQGMLHTTDRFISMLVVWNGQQASGGQGSRPLSLCVDPVTGSEIQLADLFVDAQTARARLQELIELNILDSISDYLEYAELLPVPEDCFYMDSDGLTVYYDDQHYRTFSGECGAVSFAWYEIADLIDPDGPAGMMTGDRTNISELSKAVESGSFGTVFPVSLGETLEAVLGRYPKMSDPDYTSNSKLYLFEAAALRGYAVEIPKYAFTPDLETPISAIRSSRIDFYGLRVGWTGRDEITGLLGEPEKTIQYDARQAEDMMMSPGESLIYMIGGKVLEVHLDEEALVSMLILRTDMPE